MKILITGVAGFVGGHMVAYLQQLNIGIKIIGLYNNQLPNFAPDKNLKLIQCNMMDVALLGAIMIEQKPTHIIHLAAQSSVANSWVNPANTFTNNVGISINLCEAVRKGFFPPNILFVGSSEVYGKNNAEKLSEDMMCQPNNPYAIARQAEENMLNLYYNEYAMKITRTRSFNHFGPGQDERFVIASFAKQIMQQKNEGKKNVAIQVGNLGIVRDFLDVRDVVGAYYALLLIENYDVYNVCSGMGTSIGEIVNALATACDVTVHTIEMNDRIRINDVASIVGDNSKIIKRTSWSPKIKLVDSMRDMVNDMQ